MKKRIETNRLYYGFPVVLVAYYDNEGKANATTLSSTYTLGDMVVLGFGKDSVAAKRIREGADFTINIPDRTLEKEVSICGTLSGDRHNKIEKSGLNISKSNIVDAPIIEECKIAIECSPYQVIANEQFENYINIIAKIKGRVVESDLLDEKDNMIYGKIDILEYLGDENKRVFRNI